MIPKLTTFEKAGGKRTIFSYNTGPIIETGVCYLILISSIIMVIKAEVPSSNRSSLSKIINSSGLFLANEEHFAIMWENWKTNLVGDFETSPHLLEDPDVQKYIAKVSANADELFEWLDKSESRSRLWKRKRGDSDSADMTTQFENLLKIALAYGTKDTNIYKNQNVLTEIVSGLDFMTTKGLYRGNQYLGNWWDWQIGTPQQFTNILIIIGDKIQQEKIYKYVSIMRSYLPNPYQEMKTKYGLGDVEFKTKNSSGANRSDQAFTYLGLGLLSRDSEMIRSAIDSIQIIFEFTTRGDGFYKDGSFIQHTDISYTGSYGNSHIEGMGNIFAIINRTQWQQDDQKINRYVTMVQNGFVPLVVNSRPMSMAYGRLITRIRKSIGSPTMYNLLITAEIATNLKQKRELQQAAKYWMVQNLKYFRNYARNLKELLLTKQVLADTSFDTSTKPFLGSHIYASTDRYVYSNPTFQLGISMYSCRISAFETDGSENKKGWHLSDGMMYLYNSDQQFQLAYWPTVDWYRLPGTTVDTVPLENELIGFRSYYSKETYVGGVTDKRDAFISMQLNKNGMKINNKVTALNLEAKKSWFVIDGKIICLGTDIKGTTNSSIETIIENRLLDPDSTYTFVDNQGREANTKNVLEVSSSDWFLLKSSKSNQSIGYLMLDNHTIQTKREVRSGTYGELNGKPLGDTEYYNGTYQKIIVLHGDNVQQGHYVYVTYPDTTENMLSTMATKSPYIIFNNADIQAVMEKNSKTIGATVWNEFGGTVAKIHINRPATLLLKQFANNRITLSISNPKQTNELIEVKLPRKIKEVITKDERITVKDKNTIEVDTTGALGKSFQFTAIILKEKEEVFSL